MKAPCETIVWHLLPAMRAEIAKSLLDGNSSYFIKSNMFTHNMTKSN